MNRDLLPVKEDDIRPGRPDGTCFFCGVPIGHIHAKSCVTTVRTVLVKFEVTVVKEVPSDWDIDLINFHMNDSSWCASNLVNDLRRISSQRENGCLCGNISGEYVREATEADHQEYGVVGQDGDKERELWPGEGFDKDEAQVRYEDRP